jgi:hypothetical protein
MTHLLPPFKFFFFEGGRSGLENQKQKLEGKEEGRKDERKEEHPDRWDKQMDSRDGQSDGMEGWTDWMGNGRNQMDGKDEEGMDKFFLLLSLLSFALSFLHFAL